MADSKISDLTAVTSLVGTDEFVLARTGATKKVAAVDLFAAITGTTIVTSLPGSPADGDEVYLKLGSGDTAILWHMKYDSSITDSYKWRYLGGPPLFSYTATSENRNSGTYAVLSSLPSVTLPGIGVYEFSHGFDSTKSGAATWGIQSVMTNGSTPADDADAVQYKPVGNDSAGNVYFVFIRTVSSIATSAAATCVYRTGASTDFSKRWLSVRPVRLG